MDSSLLAHLLALVERTGDRLVVVDPSTRKPFIVMGLAQYESLLRSDADHNADLARGSQRGSFGPHVDDQRGSFVDTHGTTDGAADIVPGTDPIALRANAALAAWRAETPADVAAPETIALPRMPSALEGFSAEPLQSVARTDDQFYVEPIE